MINKIKAEIERFEELDEEGAPVEDTLETFRECRKWAEELEKKIINLSEVWKCPSEFKHFVKKAFHGDSLENYRALREMRGC